MLKLSKKDDLTLVEFLMSCQSSGETAEYISAYLGKSPDVASFTAEFIRRKAAQLSGGKSVSASLLGCVFKSLVLARQTASCMCMSVHLLLVRNPHSCCCVA